MTYYSNFDFPDPLIGYTYVYPSVKKINLRVINNENYENNLKIGEIVIADDFVNDGEMTYYRVVKEGLSIYNFAWLMESHFEIIN
jgi:hypothetical protein